eukprot:GSMAST32.ASY1.ANO1.623.1 assembled CDS
MWRGDRFIPNRKTNIETTSFLSMLKENHEPYDTFIFKKQVASILFNSCNTSRRVFSFTPSIANSPRNTQNTLENIRSLYCRGKQTTKTPKGSRNISLVKVLDAPDLLDDYYLNLLDWSVDNILAVALQSFLFLYGNDYISSVKFSSADGNILAIGTTWSYDGISLASGGNDNLCCIWDSRYSMKLRCILRAHKAAVKAIAWCPHQSHLLASGCNDKTIKFWNTSILSNEATCIKSVFTGSQVNFIFTCKFYFFLIFFLNFFFHTKFQLTGHTKRVLHLCTSPDGALTCSGEAMIQVDGTKKTFRLRCGTLSSKR